jgi:hypothetical protein
VADDDTDDSDVEMLEDEESSDDEVVDLADEEDSDQEGKPAPKKKAKTASASPSAGAGAASKRTPSKAAAGGAAAATAGRGSGRGGKGKGKADKPAMTIEYHKRPQGSPGDEDATAPKKVRKVGVMLLASRWQWGRRLEITGSWNDYGHVECKRILQQGLNGVKKWWPSESLAGGLPVGPHKYDDANCIAPCCAMLCYAN